MRQYLFIGCGSILGAMLRYLLKGVEIRGCAEKVPLNTLLINVSGAFILALVLTAAFEVRAFDADVRLGLTTGFLGAFTTFSSLCKETAALMQNGDYFSAVSYVTVSAALGLGAVCLGSALARGAAARLPGKKKGPVTDRGESEAD